MKVAFLMKEIHAGKSMLVEVSAKFELSLSDCYKKMSK